MFKNVNLRMIIKNSSSFKEYKIKLFFLFEISAVYFEAPRSWSTTGLKYHGVEVPWKILLQNTTESQFRANPKECSSVPSNSLHLIACDYIRAFKLWTLLNLYHRVIHRIRVTLLEMLYYINKCLEIETL